MLNGGRSLNSKCHKDSFHNQRWRELSMYQMFCQWRWSEKTTCREPPHVQRTTWFCERESVTLRDPMPPRLLITEYTRELVACSPKMMSPSISQRLWTRITHAHIVRSVIQCKRFTPTTVYLTLYFDTITQFAVLDVSEMAWGVSHLVRLFFFLSTYVSVIMCLTIVCVFQLMCVSVCLCAKI